LNIQEPLIKSGQSKLRFKMFGIKARIARQPAIAKICSADTGNSGRKKRVHHLIRDSFRWAQYQQDS
jgi:hypothetical protein